MRDLVEKVCSRIDLTEGEARALLGYLTDPDMDPMVAAAALAGLRAKGETADEVKAFALGLREIAVSPDLGAGNSAVDIVGTGGDGSGSLNLSTGAALVAAAAGIPVVKHGNRSISSRSGSADVLAALGLDLPWEPRQAADTFAETGFTFLFAPTYHPAMKSVAPVRRALGIRTIFNLVGPLANPAKPPFSVIGAHSLDSARILASTLAAMPIERALVVHGASGWDEPTPIGPYHLFEVTPGSVEESMEDPGDFGLRRCTPTDLAGGTPEFNADAMRRVFNGEHGPHRDALILGASLAFRVTGRERDPMHALELASSAIDDGRVVALLSRLSGGHGD